MVTSQSFVQNSFWTGSESKWFVRVPAVALARDGEVVRVEDARGVLVAGAVANCARGDAGRPAAGETAVAHARDVATLVEGALGVHVAGGAGCAGQSPAADISGVADAVVVGVAMGVGVTNVRSTDDSAGRAAASETAVACAIDGATCARLVRLHLNGVKTRVELIYLPDYGRGRRWVTRHQNAGVASE